MIPIDKFVSYLKTNKDDLEDKIISFSSFIFKNNLINFIYEVKYDNKYIFLQIVHIGAPVQFISTLNHSVSTPLRLIKIDITEVSLLHRVISEKKAIYFKKVPNLALELLPNLKQTFKINEFLFNIGISDLAVIPIDIAFQKTNEEFLLAVLGPLDESQKQFLKEVSNQLMNFFNSK